MIVTIIYFLVRHFLKSKDAMKKERTLYVFFCFFATVTIMFIQPALGVLGLISYNPESYFYQLTAAPTIIAAYGIFRYDRKKREEIFSDRSALSLLINEDGEILSSSPSVQHMLEYSEDDLVGYHLDAILGGGKEEYDAFMANPRGGQKPVRTSLMTKSGGELPVDLFISKLVGADSDQTFLLFKVLS